VTAIIQNLDMQKVNAATAYCIDIWNRAAPASPDFPHLVEKAANPYSLRSFGNSVAIALRNRDGNIVNLQFICSDGCSAFVSDDRIIGNYSSIGAETETVYFCVDFTTGASVHEATGCIVVVVCITMNLQPVVEIIQQKYPGKNLIVCADNDPAATANATVDAAKAIRDKLGIPYVQPVIDGEKCNFNDVHRRCGLDEVARQLAVMLDSESHTTWMEDFVLDDHQVSKLANPTWVYRNLIIRGHILVVPAPPNGGKTTLFLWIAGQISDLYKVFYVNADVSGSDAKKMAEQAKKNGFTMMLPDLVTGLSMAHVLGHLEEMNRQGGDFSDMVFIIDTLKKMTDVINKSSVKRLFQTLRGLTGKGMTIVLLAHTNKYKDDEGKHIFEGTGDVRADVDEMIYLESQKHSDKSMTISTVPDKVRGDFQPLTFEVTENQEVTFSEEYRDIRDDRRRHKQLEKDQEVIGLVRESLCNECINQQEIVEYCKAAGFGQRKVRGVLERYTDNLWCAEKGEKNAWNYKLKYPGMSGKTG
jgi:hypothetical protein